MTTHNLRRWGAVLLIGGLLMTAAYLIYPASAHDALIRPAAGLGLAGVLLALPGLIAFQVAQSARARAVSIRVIVSFSACTPTSPRCWA